jgi:hypothetical protein
MVCTDQLSVSSTKGQLAAGKNFGARRVTQRTMSELGQQETSLGSCEHLLTWTAAAQAARHAEGSATPPITQTHVDRFKHFPLD